MARYNNEPHIFFMLATLYRDGGTLLGVANTGQESIKYITQTVWYMPQDGRACVPSSIRSADIESSNSEESSSAERADIL